MKEALACDIAVVSSDVGDVRDLMASTPGTGIFSEAATPDAIARLLHGCIQQCTEYPGARRQRVRAAGVSAEQVMQRLEVFILHWRSAHEQPIHRFKILGSSRV